MESFGKGDIKSQDDKIRQDKRKYPTDDILHGHVRNHSPENEKVQAERRGDQGQFEHKNGYDPKPQRIIT